MLRRDLNDKDLKILKLVIFILDLSIILLGLLTIIYPT